MGASMPRDLYAYTLLPEDRLPADVVRQTIERPHRAIPLPRPVPPLVSFILARCDQRARFRKEKNYVPRTHLNIANVLPPARMHGWTPTFRRGPWPDAIARELFDRGLEHITPLHVAMGCFPSVAPSGSPRTVEIIEYPGVPEMWVWAHGLELTEQEHDLALEGMQTLLHDPLFLIWAANPDPDFIPRSFALDVSPLQRLLLFRQLKLNPLSVPAHRRARFLDLGKATPEYILELPRLPQWTLRSTHISADPVLRALQIASSPTMHERF